MSTYLFIDGAYLHQAYRESMQRFYGSVPSINYEALETRIFGNIARVYWYDAVDRSRIGDESETQHHARVAAQDQFHAYLNSLSGWHVREGFVSRGRRATRRTQKAVDVQLAVDALEHAVSRNMSQATIVCGDLDFEPLLFSLNRFGVKTRVWFERASASPELLEAADERRQFSLTHFHGISTASFRDANPTPTYGDARPDLPIERVGRWHNRRVELLMNQDGGGERSWFVCAGAGDDPVREPKLHAHYPKDDVGLAESAFTIQYGHRIDWQD